MEEESFDIKGVHFSYGDKFIKKFGYHRPSTQVDISRKTVSISRSVIFQRKKDMSSLRSGKKIKNILQQKYRKLSNDKFPVFCILDSYTIIRN